MKNAGKAALIELVEGVRHDPDASAAAVASFAALLRRLKGSDAIEEALTLADVRLVRDYAPEAYDELAAKYGLLADV